MSTSIDPFFSVFSGNVFERNRASSNGPTSLTYVPRVIPGTGYCEGCCTRKPLRGTKRKGWRCIDCKPAKNATENQT
jgi:hypothetical protein